MTKNKPTEFGVQDREDPIYGIYIEKPIAITLSNLNLYGGVLIDVREGYAFLEPHQGIIYDSEGKANLQMIESTQKIPLEGAVISPTTQGSLEGFCVNYNKQVEESEKQRLKNQETNEKSKD